jgi:hypothetical protein
MRQARGVHEIHTAVDQIDRITQGVAAGAEESARAAEQLASQSATLTDMVSTFKRTSATETKKELPLPARERVVRQRNSIRPRSMP